MIDRFATPKSASRTIACILLTVIISVCWTLSAQAKDASKNAGKPKPEKLFGSNRTLTVALRAPWGDIVRDKDNPKPYPATLEFTDENGQAHSVPLTVARRGLTRQKVCEFPPIKMHFRKHDVKGTIFHGQGALKLVTHCDVGTRWEQYYVKEMLAYRMYNLITELSFRVRPLTITYIDSRNDHSDRPRFAFLIEDEGDVAKRNGLKKLKIRRIRPEQLDSKEASRMYLFQFMIGNADWSALSGAGVRLCCHNTKLMGIDAASKIYAVPYDFDSSGLVDAHYAVPNAGLPIGEVTERLYRGFCIHNPTLETARQEYLSKEQAIYSLVKGESRLNSRSVKRALRYLGEFFDILRSNYKFDRNIIQRCRK